MYSIHAYQRTKLKRASKQYLRLLRKLEMYNSFEQTPPTVLESFSLAADEYVKTKIYEKVLNG